MFLKSGFRMRLCGHSLGAGVAVIIGLLLRQMPAFQQQGHMLQVRCLGVLFEGVLGLNCVRFI